MPEAAPAGSWERLSEAANGYRVSLDPGQLGRLQRYFDFLCEWNQKFNLTAIEEPEAILVKHFLDSLTCASVYDFARAHTLLDVGTGAGFPGLVLKVAFPHLRVTLLDSLRKRLNFLDRVAEALELGDVITVHARAEDAGHDPLLRERFDCVTARAVARVNVLAEWTIPFARVGGAVLMMKGPHPEEELREAGKALRTLGAGAVAHEELRLPWGGLGRTLILVPKRQPTPRLYPRPPGTAKRYPL